MGANKSIQEEKERSDKGKIGKIDIYILALFAAQIYIYSQKSVSNNFAVAEIIASTTNFNAIVFALYCLSFFMIFLNFFYLLAAYKKQDVQEKEKFLSAAFVGTIIFFILSFILDIFIQRLNQPFF